jgi:nucleosome binding factor SPN SPT16 subunit
MPCDGELIILIHLHLKNAILYNKKKHLDIQFYAEVGEMTTDLAKARMGDRDDLASEQADREMRHKFKETFKRFCDRVKEQTQEVVEFDEPIRDLGFHGVPHRENVFLVPTSTCLINLTQFPSFVIAIDEIELVHFERIGANKNFDMVFILKNYNEKVRPVNAIEMKTLDHVKSWLNSCDIKYTEGVQSLNWVKVMKTITDDPEGFFENGGWNFLGAEGGSDESGDEDEDLGSDDEEFNVSEEDGSDEEEDSDDDYSSENASDEDYDNELDSDQSSGKEWSDLEEEAKESDENKSDGEGQRSRIGKSKHKSSHKSQHKERSNENKHKSSSRDRKENKHHSSSKSTSHHNEKSVVSKDKERNKERNESHHISNTTFNYKLTSG